MGGEARYRPEHAQAASLRRPERIAGAVLAVAMQAGFLALLILSRPVFAPPPNAAHELTFILPRLEPEAAPLPLRTAPLFAPMPAVRLPPPPMAPPGASVPDMHALPATPDLRALGQSIFGCRVDLWANLTAEQRARCPRPGEGVAIQDAPNLMGTRSHVKDEAHWEDEWAREKSPPLLPCGGFVDVLCLLGKIADGSLSDYGDPKTWPHYEVQQLSKEDFYKVEQAYDAWNKAHPTRDNAQ